MEFKFATLRDLEAGLGDELPLDSATRRVFASLLQSPDGSPDFPCFFYIWHEGAVLSFYHTEPDVLACGNDRFPWAWGGDLRTLPEHRKKGLATRLFSESLKILHDRGLAWGGVFATDINLRICRNLGFLIPGFATRRLLFKTARPALEYWSVPKRLWGLLDSMYATCFRVTRELTWRGEGQAIAIEKYEQGIDLPAPVYREKLHFNDSFEKLWWRISGREARLYVVRGTGAGAPLGYFVVKKRSSDKTIAKQFGLFELMTIMDFGVFSKDRTSYGGVMGAALDLFQQSDADVLEIIASSETMNREALKRGMLKAGRGMSFAFSPPPEWDLDPGAAELRHWHLTHSSGDGYSFP